MTGRGTRWDIRVSLCPHTWKQIELMRELVQHDAGRTPGMLAALERIEALQRAYFRELRNIVAQSEPMENVAVVNLQHCAGLLARPRRVSRRAEPRERRSSGSLLNAVKARSEMRAARAAPRA